MSLKIRHKSVWTTQMPCTLLHRFYLFDSFFQSSLTGSPCYLCARIIQVDYRMGHNFCSSALSSHWSVEYNNKWRRPNYINAPVHTSEQNGNSKMHAVPLYVYILSFALYDERTWRMRHKRQRRATNGKKVRTRTMYWLRRSPAGSREGFAHNNIRVASSPIQVIYQLNNKWYIIKHPFGNNRKSTKPTAHILRAQRTMWTHPESELPPITREYFRYFAKNKWMNRSTMDNRKTKTTKKYAEVLCNLFSFLQSFCVFAIPLTLCLILSQHILSINCLLVISVLISFFVAVCIVVIVHRQLIDFFCFIKIPPSKSKKRPNVIPLPKPPNDSVKEYLYILSSLQPFGFCFLTRYSVVCVVTMWGVLLCRILRKSCEGQKKYSREK